MNEKSIKILIAEDDKFLKELYSLTFSNGPYDFSITSNGKEFLEKIKNFLPDIIIIDLIMPVMDGFDLIKSLKTNPEYKEIPIIVASSLGQSDDINKAIKLGASDYLVKSDIKATDITEKIKAILEK